MPSILVTGANGFVGYYLLSALETHYAGKKLDIVACYHGDIPEASKRFNVKWFELDITNHEMVAGLVKEIKPEYVVHLAAISHVPTANSSIERTWQINVMGSLHLFETIKKYTDKSNVFFISSSEVYGRSFIDTCPVIEGTCLNPMNIYASTKAAVDLLIGHYGDERHKFIRVRPFNHIGPGQTENFVVPAFASQIARIEKGQQAPVIKVGNLSAIRDLLDVRDVISAYILMIEKVEEIDNGAAINIASGIGYKIGDLLDKLLEMTDVDITIETDENRLRPSEIARAIGDASLAKDLLGWNPQLDIKTTLSDVLNEWRTRLSN